jgi:hypothetical protein
VLFAGIGQRGQHFHLAVIVARPTGSLCANRERLGASRIGRAALTSLCPIKKLPIIDDHQGAFFGGRTMLRWVDQAARRAIEHARYSPA